MAKKSKEEKKLFCRDCRLHFDEHSHPVVNGVYDKTKFILCHCPYSPDAKLLNHDNCKRIQI